VPVDGVVEDGRTAVDESMVSGEPVPVEKVPGARVTAGTVNGTGSFVMRADRVGADTLLAQIVRMVGEAQRSRAPIQRWPTEWPPGSSYRRRRGGAGVRRLGLVGTGAAAGARARLRRGRVDHRVPLRSGTGDANGDHGGDGSRRAGRVLIKNAEALERLEDVDTIVVDKTGTLTEGKPALADVVPADGFDGADVLRLAASLEQGSEHPLAAAIVGGALARGLPVRAATRFESITGKGVRGEVDGRHVVLGNAALMQDDGIDIRGIADRAEDGRRNGSTVMFVAVDGRVGGLLAVADPVKASTKEAIDLLHRDGLRVVMLTGDNRTTAEAVGRLLGLDDIHAEVLRPRSARWSVNSSNRAIAWPWPATESTTLRRSRRRTSGSRWVREPTSPSRALASRW
jgi:Cu+-exporting ATPase